jgi:hypothetical protein
MQPAPPSSPPSFAFQWPLNLAARFQKAKLRGNPFCTPNDQKYGLATGRNLRARDAMASAATVLPMEPQPSAMRRQWFEGWFLRLVDHSAEASIAVIFGSLRRKRGEQRGVSQGPFDEHLIVLAYDDGRDGSHHMRSVKLEGGEVAVQGRPSSEELGESSAPGAGNGGAAGAHVSWWSDRHGGLRVRGDVATLDLRFTHGLRLVANVSSPRLPWRAERPDTEGPEGWLSRTGLLPCHYFVHSFGSPVTYSLWHEAGGGAPDPGAGARGARLRRRRLVAAGRGAGAVGSQPRLTGTGAVAHIERNWGASFPTGWVWAQAAAPGGAAYLVLTGGRFVIGPLTTNSYVIGLRAPRATAERTAGRGRGSGLEGRIDSEGALWWDFRTTDLDRIADARLPCDGVLALNATSRNGRRRLQLVLSAPPATFGARIMVPTMNDGFSDDPGCRESYVARASIVAWDAPSGRELLKEDVPLAVLEFGGEFQCPTG